jgi:DNA invertase Pin-like site-specific DNA recombinase
MSDRSKITEAHRRRRAVVYVRQSTLGQVERNTESMVHGPGILGDTTPSKRDETRGKDDASPPRRSGLFAATKPLRPRD